MNSLDGNSFKAQQLILWNASARPWEVWHDRIEGWFAPMTAKLLELGGVRPGQDVLDLGTGYGEPALSAARRVGPRGSVLGIDISPAMLEVARKRARGLSNVRFAEVDIEALETAAQFDVALSRLGIMFMVERVRTLQAIRRALKPGGVLAAAVWGPPSTHLLSQALGGLMGRLELPAAAPGTPSPFSMSDREQVMRECRDAGFVETSVTELVVSCDFGSVDELVRFNQEALPPQILSAIEEKFGSANAPEAWSLVAEAVRSHLRKDGSLVLLCLTLCVQAVAPEDAPSEV